MTFGYALRPPGPDAWGNAIDDVPMPQSAGNLRHAHSAWRARAEGQLTQRLNSGQLAIWYPVALPAGQIVVPLVGGNPTVDWVEALDVIAAEAFDMGSQLVRVVDLTRHAVWSSVQLQAAGGARTRVGELAPGQTTSDLFDGLSTGAAVTMILDVLRAEDNRLGRNRSARSQAILTDVAKCLGGLHVGLDQLHAAVVYALTLSPGVAGLSSSQLDELENYHARQVQQRSGLANELDELEHLLGSVMRFRQVQKPVVGGTDPARRVDMRGIRAGLSTFDHEIASDLLASRLAFELGEVDARKSARITVLLGVDSLSPPVLHALTAAAQRNASLLFLMYERFDGTAIDLIGSAGASVGGFFRLGNHQEAQRAADFMGRQHRFEMTGISENQSRAFEWGWSTSVGKDQSTSRAWQAGSMFSRTTTRSTSHSQSKTKSSGQSSSTGSSRDWQRVYEHILDPSNFQQLPPASMMLVDVSTRTAELVSCSRDVRMSRLVSRSQVLELGR